jgi:hypothetical protein
VRDRHNVYHLLQPGQRVRDVEMLNEDIEFFQREAATRRINRGEPRIMEGKTIPTGGTFLPNPIIIEDCGSMLKVSLR